MSPMPDGTYRAPHHRNVDRNLMSVIARKGPELALLIDNETPAGASHYPAGRGDEHRHAGHGTGDVGEDHVDGGVDGGIQGAPVPGTRNARTRRAGPAGDCPTAPLLASVATREADVICAVAAGTIASDGDTDGITWHVRPRPVRITAQRMLTGCGPATSWPNTETSRSASAI